MAYVPTQFEGKTVRIPIRMRNGRMVSFDGGKLPLFKEDAIGDLVMDESAVDDEEFLAQQEGCSVPFLPAGTKILFLVEPSGDFRPVPAPLLWARDLPSLDRAHWPYHSGPAACIEVISQGELRLRLRGAKKAVLQNVRCSITALNCEAGSLNEAYTCISAAYELKRRSHAGNVFQKGIYEENGNWRQLDSKRNELEVKFANENVPARPRARRRKEAAPIPDQVSLEFGTDV